MTRMTGPDCAVMCNLINIHTYIHTNIHTYIIIRDPKQRWYVLANLTTHYKWKTVMNHECFHPSTVQYSTVEYSTRVLVVHFCHIET